VLRNRRLWPLLPLSFSGYAVLITVRGLWAGPYLADSLDLGPVARGNVLLGMSCATILRTLGYGLIERHLGRRRPVILGSTGAALALVLLAVAPTTSPIAAATLLAALGALGATYPLIMAQGRQFLADHEIGRGLTLLNGSCFIGAAFVQAGSGVVIVAGSTSLEAQHSGYALLFLTLALLLAASIAVFRRSSDVRPYAAANRMEGK
jgi:sugar phosphate permease